MLPQIPRKRKRENEKDAQRVRRGKSAPGKNLVKLLKTSLYIFPYFYYHVECEKM